jgi:hypothetical protein
MGVMCSARCRVSSGTVVVIALAPTMLVVPRSVTAAWEPLLLCFITYDTHFRAKRQ